MRSRAVGMRMRLAPRTSLRRARQKPNLTARRSLRKRRLRSLNPRTSRRQMKATKRKSRKLLQARKSPKLIKGKRRIRNPTTSQMTKQRRVIPRVLRRPHRKRQQRLRNRRRSRLRAPGGVLELRQRGIRPSKRSTLMPMKRKMRHRRRRRLRRPSLKSRHRFLFVFHSLESDRSGRRLYPSTLILVTKET